MAVQDDVNVLLTQKHGGGAWNSASPLILSVLPAEVEQDATVVLTITGLRLSANAVVTTTSLGITINSVEVDTINSVLLVEIDVDIAAILETIDITITNPNGLSYTIEDVVEVISPIPLDPPDAPVISLAASGNTITITNTDPNNDETGYEYQISIDDNLSFATIFTSGPNNLSKLIEDLEFSTLYFARVRALAPQGNSSWSNEESITTDAPPILDAPVANITLITNDGNPKITWEPIAGATSYVVQKSLRRQVAEWSEVSTQTETEYTDTSFTGATTWENGFFYRITAQNDVTESAPSDLLPFHLTKQNAATDIAFGTGLTRGVTAYANITTLPIRSILERVEVNVLQPGNLDLIVMQPAANGGFNVIQTVTLTGLLTGVTNSRSLSAGTLPLITVPKHSIIAFWMPTGQAQIRFNSDSSSIGYLTFTGKPVGNNVVPAAQIVTGSSVNVHLWHRHVDDADETTYGVVYDENFSGNVLPAWARNKSNATPWTFNGSYAENPTGTGLSTGLIWSHCSNANNNTLEVDFEFTGANDVFAIARQPVMSGYSVNDGSILGLDRANNRLIIYTNITYSQTTLPTVQSNNPITGMALAVGVRYRASISKAENDITFSIKRLSDNVTFSKTINVWMEGTGQCGRAYGHPEVFNITGSTRVFNLKWYFDPDNLIDCVLICGDSILFNAGGTVEGTLLHLFLQNGQNCLSSCDSGTYVLSTVQRLQHELRLYRPDVIICQGGTNNADDGPTNWENPSSITGKNMWRPQINKIWNLMQNSCSFENIMGALIPRNDSLQSIHTEMNQLMIADGIEVGRWDLVVSVNNDGITWNPSLMNDTKHMNDSGTLLVYSQL